MNRAGMIRSTVIYYKNVNFTVIASKITLRTCVSQLKVKVFDIFQADPKPNFFSPPAWTNENLFSSNHDIMIFAGDRLVICL